MKIVYVGDNRCRGNFGCRGTSTALSQLISKNNEIVGRITGRHTMFNTEDLYVVKGKNKSFYEKKASHKYWQYERKMRYFLHKVFSHGRGGFLLSKYDFASLNFDEAIENLLAAIPANPELKEFDLSQYDFDAVVVNGEGSFIFAEQPWRESVIEAMEMYWAKKMGKKVYYLNGMLSDDPHSPHNQNTIDSLQELFNSCDGVYVREYESLRYANKYFPNVDTKLVPDALFSWYDMVNDSHKVENYKYYIGHSGECDEDYTDLDFTKPYVLISGSSAISSVPEEQAIASYSNLVEKAKEKLGCNVFLIHVDEGDEFLLKVAQNTHTPIIAMDTPLVAAAKILANAKVYISGRYHPAIMSSLGGTPCVFMGSNSHKTKSLQELLQYDDIEEFNLAPNEEECERIIDKAKRAMSQPELRSKIQTRTFELSRKAMKLAEVVK